MPAQTRDATEGPTFIVGGPHLDEEAGTAYVREWLARSAASYLVMGTTPTTVRNPPLATRRALAPRSLAAAMRLAIGLSHLSYVESAWVAPVVDRMYGQMGLAGARARYHYN